MCHFNRDTPEAYPRGALKKSRDFLSLVPLDFSSPSISFFSSLEGGEKIAAKGDKEWEQIVTCDKYQEEEKSKIYIKSILIIPITLSLKTPRPFVQIKFGKGRENFRGITPLPPPPLLLRL